MTQLSKIEIQGYFLKIFQSILMLELYDVMTRPMITAQLQSDLADIPILRVSVVRTQHVMLMLHFESE